MFSTGGSVEESAPKLIPVVGRILFFCSYRTVSIFMLQSRGGQLPLAPRGLSGPVHGPLHLRASNSASNLSLTCYLRLPLWPHLSSSSSTIVSLTEAGERSLLLRAHVTRLHPHGYFRTISLSLSLKS